jgi:3-oxoacyl-[acyl-carrier-protein] synthase-1
VRAKMAGVMMNDKMGVFVVSDNILSPLGDTTAQNFSALINGSSGVKIHHIAALSLQPIAASLFKGDEALFKLDDQYTKFEKLLIASVSDALSNSDINAADKKTVLIICTTKGNISLLETEEHNDTLKKRIALSTSAKLVADHFGFVNTPVIISNACISGVVGILTGMRLLRSGQYENAVIAGADVVSKFVLSGFQSFQALSNEVCKPFDKARTGLNLGEGAGTIIISSQSRYSNNIQVAGGAVSNDANHISGPSRTGVELGYAIKKAIADAGIVPADISFISAHGTATVYNDEMEANAINLAGLNQVPVNSLKPYYGHTLGAAGLIESIISIASLKQNIVLPTLGYNEAGVTKPIKVNAKTLHIPLSSCLKTASGFGGCNAAVVFNKSSF